MVQTDPNSYRKLFPAVSVVMPVYNSERFIGDAIKSVQAQTFAAWELLLVDDCSTDQSASIAEDFCVRDSRIKLIKLKCNSGAALARNAAIELCAGRYIAFLDSDDQWAEDKLEKQLGFMERKRCALCYSWYECVDEDGNKIGKTYRPPDELSYSDLLKSNQIGCLTAMYDTEILGKVLMPLIRKRQDYGLWLKILRQVEKAYCLPESLAYYRQRTGSISSNKLEMLKYNWSLYRKIENLSMSKSAYYLGWNIARKVLG